MIIYWKLCTVYVIFCIGVTVIFGKEICEEISGSVSSDELKKKFSKQNKIRVNLGENIEVNCEVEKSVRSVFILAKRSGVTEDSPYYFKMLVNFSNKMEEKMDHDNVFIVKTKISDENIKLSLNVKCIHNKVSILCIKHHTCRIPNSTAQIDITSKITNSIFLKDGKVIEKAHSFSKVEGYLSQTYGLALTITFRMCQTMIYHYVRTVGFGNTLSSYSTIDSSKARPKVIIVNFFVYKDNCRYNIEPYITTTVIFPFHEETYRVGLDLFCFHSEAYIVYLFFVVFCFFVCGWGPILMVRKRWFETDFELRLIRAYLRKKARSSQVIQKRGSKMT